MKSLRWVATGVLALAGSLAGAQTTVTQWGVSAVAAHADCSLAFPCSFPTIFGAWIPTVDLPSSGGLNQTSASRIDVQHVHDIIDPPGEENMGLTSAQVQLDNTNLSVPVLKAKASSLSDNGWVSGMAFGIQGYQYTGAGPTTANLTASLSGTITNPSAALNGGISDVTGFSIGVWLLRFDPDLTFPSDPAATLGQLVSSVIAATTVADSWTPPDIIANGSVNVSEPLSITLEPGEEFYLMAGLTASATGPGRGADAFSTLTMGFDPNVANNLLPAGVAPIPEPEIYAMFLAGLGLLGMAVRVRKKKTRIRRIY